MWHSYHGNQTVYRPTLMNWVIPFSIAAQISVISDSVNFLSKLYHNSTQYSRLLSIVFSSSVVLTTCPIWVISRMKNCLRCSIWTLSFPATILSLTSRSTMLECELHNVIIHDMRTCHFVSPCHIRYSLASIAFSVVLQVREAGVEEECLRARLHVSCF